MKIVTLGAGPAGLYASLLLKKNNPALDITVLERNPPDATYGWGVVFSDRTLNAFREADPKSYKEITDQFVIWDAIDVFYHGERVRCGGHIFAGMARRELLLILQERCQELGVKLKFNTEIDNLAQFAGADLILACDGVNSLTRKTYEDAFKPSLTPGKAKYVWYGTHRVFDSFTFIFKENEHGLFQVHAYPFNGDTSTFIVECEEEVWRRAGLDQAGEAESMAYCENLFAEYLEGHRLMSNRSLWINFQIVKNKTWRHKNMILLGDAAHTAHFSIGSGTKLAMDDAIALANAFEQYGDLETAFKNYEAERRPRVEALQAAALESQTYFENVKRYTYLDPLQFTFHLMTRSGRISYDNLRQRDPRFSETVDRYFITAACVDQDVPTGQFLQDAPLIAPPPMFVPLQLRGLTLTNRVALSPVSTGAAREGLPNETHHQQLLHRAKSGAGLVLTEPVAVTAEGRITSGDAGLYCAEHQAAWAKIVEAVHHESLARLGLQLNHAGRRGSTQPRRLGLDRPLRRGNWPLLSASALPYTAYSQTPKAMDRADMDQVRAAFVQAAKMAAEIGFDWLQLHFGHGYLLGSFLSPLTNQRQDEYGGSPEKRLRFPVEVLDAVRAAWPAEKPLSVALNATDWARGGLDVDEAVTIAHTLKAHGCDLIEVLAGQTASEMQPTYDTYFLAPYSEQIRHEARLPTMIGGGLTLTDQVNSVLAAGRADLCVMSPLGLRE